MIGKLIKYLKYSSLILNKNLFLSVLIAIQLGVVAFSINGIIVYRYNQGIEHNLSEELAKNNGIYYVKDRPDDILSELKDVDVYMQLFETNADIRGKSVDVQIFTEDILNIAQYPLYKGEWFSNTVSKDKLQIVVTQNMNLNVGDVVEVEFMDSRLHLKEIKAEVSGILPNNFLYYKMTGSSSIESNMSTRFLYQKGDKNTSMIFCSEEQAISEDIFISSIKIGSYINFKTDINKDTLENNLFKLRQNGKLSSLVNMMHNSQNDYKRTLFLVIPFIIFIGLLVLISTVFLLAISIKSSVQLLAILHLQGARWKDIQGIVLLYSFMIVIGAIVLTIISNNSVMSTISQNYAQNSLISYLVLMIVLAAYIVIVLVTTKVFLRKDELISKLKEAL